MGPRLGCVLVVALLSGVAPGALVGATANELAQPLGVERIRALPASEQKPWLDYLASSAERAKMEKEFRANEARAAQVAELKLAPYASVFGVVLDQPVEWFATGEGRRVTANILSYQTPSGGWSKRLDLGKGPRLPGTDFVSEHNAHYEGTFDNDATTTQMRALARAAKATDNEGARAAFLRGLRYIFAAQYPNGGWPQIYPVEGGYHDAITFNDDAMVNVLRLLDDVAVGGDEFEFVPADLRHEAQGRSRRGLECILRCQIRSGDKLTAWCQQHDMLTLQPCAARAFEPLGVCSAESASLLGYLMSVPAPSPAVKQAVKGAAAWLNETRISGFAWKNTGEKGRLLVAQPGGGPLWSRIYEIGTNRPIFGNPDRSVHYDVAEITLERRNGYSWYSGGPARTLERYPAWQGKFDR